MPQKTQLLLQIAQAAARVEGRQQGALPQVAVNVWDTLTGSHVPGQQQTSNRTPKQSLGLDQQHSAAAAASERLATGLSLLNISKDGHHLYPSQLLAQAGLQGHWGQQPLTGSIAADTVALYDTSQHQHLAGLMHSASMLGAPGSAFGPLSSRSARPAAAGLSSLDQSGRSGSSGSLPLGLGGVRKPRFNNSISLNKQIMNTHSMRELHTIVRSKGPSFDFFNISSAIARVPKLVGPTGGVQNDATAKALVDDLASLMANNINTFDARGLANSAWAFGKLKYAPNQKLPALIAAAAVDKMEAFSAQNLSNLLWSFVYLHYRDEQLMTAVAKQVVSKVKEFKPQELANVVWAFASMEHYDPQLMDVVGQRALMLVDQFKEQELSNVVWAFAKLHHYDEVLFTHLLAAVAAKLQHFLPQGVSNVAWGLATAGHRDDALFEHLLGHCLSDIGAYDVQGLSNLLWACATLGHNDAVFLQAALQECTSRIERMSSQNLSNALWACATLGHVDSRMLGSWAEAVMHKLNLFEPQGLSNTAWAFAKLGFRSPVLFEAMAEAALGKLDSFTAQGLSNTAWAYATMGHHHPALAQQLAEEVARQVGSFNAQNCSMTAWAFSTLRHYHPALFDVLLEQLAAQLDDVEPQNVANCLWAYARVGHPLGKHTEALVAAAKRLLPQMNQQELCNTAWALGVLGQLSVDTWQQFCACAGSVQGLTPEGVHQAFHAQLMLHSQIARDAGVPLSSLPADQLPTLPEPLHSHARYMWLTSAVDVHISKLQADVSSALLLAGVPNSMEWLTEDGLFSIDIAFQVDGQPVAVEVDGSHHYTNSVPHIPLSEVLVRRRLLQDRGWKVVNISYLDWEALPDDPHTKTAALLQVIAAELGPRSGWQQVGPLPSTQDADLASQQLHSPSHSLHSSSNTALAAGMEPWTARFSDGGVPAAAAAAAAVAAAVGGESCGGLVTPRPGGYAFDAVVAAAAQEAAFAAAVAAGNAAAMQSMYGGYGANLAAAAGFNGGVAIGIPAAMGYGGSMWGGGLNGWGSLNGPAWGGMIGNSNSWAASSSSAAAGEASMLQRLQQQRQWLNSGYASGMGAAGAAGPAEAVPVQQCRMSPEHLAVGGPTRTSPAARSGSAVQRSSSDAKGVAAAADGHASAPASPGSGSARSKAGSCCEEQADVKNASSQLQLAMESPSSGSGSEGEGIRMPAFTWADPLTSSIWGPGSAQQQA